VVTVQSIYVNADLLSLSTQAVCTDLESKHNTMGFGKHTHGMLTTVGGGGCTGGTRTLQQNMPDTGKNDMLLTSNQPWLGRSCIVLPCPPVG
jgi:hypothetical protein